MLRMIKKNVLMLLIVGMLFAGTMCLEAQKVDIFVNAGYAGDINTMFSQYRWIWGTDFVDIDEAGSILPQFSSGATFGGGINVYFSRNLGISLNVAHLKQDATVDSAYTMVWDWFDGSGDTSDGAWGNVGDATIIPISLDLVHRVHVSRDVLLSIRAGATLFLAKVNLYSTVGYADALETEDAYYVDWYALDTFVETDETIFGGHLGADLEKRLGRKIGIYIGFDYYIAPKKVYNWEVINQGTYYGELGALLTTETPDIHVSTPVEAEVNYSFFRAYAGLKIHL